MDGQAVWWFVTVGGFWQLSEGLPVFVVFVEMWWGNVCSWRGRLVFGVFGERVCGRRGMVL